jgi:hypothetical protein
LGQQNKKERKKERKELSHHFLFTVIMTNRILKIFTTVKGPVKGGRV